MQASDGIETGRLKGRRVLVVEDEYFLADDLVDRLAAAGATVVGPFADIGEALEAIAAGDVEYAVLDINLHGEMVYPLAEALRARQVPFAFATGYDAGVIPARFRDVPRLEKPFDQGSFDSMIQLVAGA